MRFVHRLPFTPTGPLDDAPTLVDRYLGRADHATAGFWPDPTRAAGDITIRLHDTGGGPRRIVAPGGATVLWHLLWTRHEAAASITIEGATWPIAPGDTVTLPGNRQMQVTGGQLAVAVTVPGTTPSIVPPTHGTEQFHGYNRQTRCAAAGGFRLGRWKMTQPLDLARHHPATCIVLALARDTVMRGSSAIEQLRQGEVAIVDPAANPVAMPDGLSYLLTIDRDPPGIT